MQSAVMTPQKKLDGVIAAGVWIGAYQKHMNESAAAIDLSAPNQDAVNYANQVLTMTQASGAFKDLPVAISRGVATGGNESFAKALAQYQTFAFFRFANVSDMLYKASQEKDAETAAQIASWWIAANVSEVAIRHGVKGAMALIFLSLLGAKGDWDDEKSLIEEILFSFIGNTPYISNVISAITYKSNPVAILSAYQQAMDSWENYARSKRAGKRLKWAAIAGLQTAGFIAGAPTGQAVRLFKQGSRSLETTPIEKAFDVDAKAKNLYSKFKKIRAEINSQKSAIKESQGAFDETLKNRIKKLDAQINVIESLIRNFNKHGGASDKIKAKLEEFKNAYES